MGLVECSSLKRNRKFLRYAKYSKTGKIIFIITKLYYKVCIKVIKKSSKTKLCSNLDMN